MSAKLDHPRLCGGGLAEDRDVETVASEIEPSAPAGFSQHLVAFHDLPDLLVALRTQRRRQQCGDGVPLWRGEVAHAQAPALENARRKIRPAPALHLVLKVEDGLPALVVAQRFQKRSRGGHDGGGLG